MRILWIVNMLLPDAADYLKVSTGISGTWMIDISKKLASDDDIQLAVACVYGNTLKKIELNNITYYLLPGTGKNMLFYTKKYEAVWKKSTTSLSRILFIFMVLNTLTVYRFCARVLK